MQLSDRDTGPWEATQRKSRWPAHPGVQTAAAVEIKPKKPLKRTAEDIHCRWRLMPPAAGKSSHGKGSATVFRKVRYLDSNRTRSFLALGRLTGDRRPRVKSLPSPPALSGAVRWLLTVTRAARWWLYVGDTHCDRIKPISHCFILRPTEKVVQGKVVELLKKRVVTACAASPHYSMPRHWQSVS
jgi:hypothetical protein